jgi:hypothetical protein
MEQSPSWEADTHLAGQEIPCLLWIPKVLAILKEISLIKCNAIIISDS